jgi:hypothetical protein
MTYENVGGQMKHKIKRLNLNLCLGVAAALLFVFGLAALLGGCSQTEGGTANKTKENVEDSVLRVRLINPEADLEILDQATISIYKSNGDMVINEAEVSADGEFVTLGHYEEDWHLIMFVRPPVYSDGTTYDGLGKASFTFDDGRCSITTYSSSTSMSGKEVTFIYGEQCNITFDLSDFKRTALTKAWLAETINEKYEVSKRVVSQYEGLSDLELSNLDGYDPFVLQRNKMKVEGFEALLKDLDETDAGDFEKIREIYHSYCSVNAVMKFDY